MVPLTLGQIAEITGGALDRGNPGLPISDIVTDTREDCHGRLFIALTGPNFDGHRFVPEASRKGAVACLSAKDLKRARMHNGFGVVRVADTLSAYQNLAAFNRHECKVVVVGITGSCGKTTTKSLTRNVIGRRFRVIATEKNENNEIGAPRTILRADADTQVIVLELGMRASGEIRQLALMARPDIAVITTIEKTHIGRLGSEEAIAAAKAEILENFTKDMPAFLNADNSWTPWVARRTNANIVTFGITGGDLRASHIACDFKGISFRVNGAGESFNVRLPLFGLANVYNALAAIAVGLCIGIPVDDIRAGLFQDIPELGRMRKVETSNGSIIIDDTYNSNPKSLAFALELLSELPWSGRRVAVLGDMLELGDFSQEEHLNVGRHFVMGNCDLLITLGAAAQFIGEGALEAGLDSDMVLHFDNLALFKRRVGTLFVPGDLVLVKGSRGMQMERVVELLAGGRA